MSSPVLQPQGTYTKPQYSAGLAGQSIPTQRPDGKSTGIVRRFDKHAKAAGQITALGLITANANDAIRYSSPAGTALRGLAQFFGWGSLGFGLWWGSFTSAPMLERVASRPVSSLIFLSLSTATVIGAVLVWLWVIRLELFRPYDEPIIFDRKNRKVYRIFCEAQPGLKGLFKPWPMRACEYDWDLIDAEHNARIVTSGSTLRRDSNLVFIVRKSADDPTIIDSFNIGSPLMMSLDETVAATYEHIRRFMEEGGPPVPEGEKLPERAPKPRAWKRVLDWSPIGAKYWQAWRQELPMMLLAHVLFPLTIVLGGLWLFFNRLAVWTSRPIVWPAEIVAAVGSDVAASQSAARVP